MSTFSLFTRSIRRLASSKTFRASVLMVLSSSMAGIIYPVSCQVDEKGRPVLYTGEAYARGRSSTIGESRASAVPVRAGKVFQSIFLTDLHGLFQGESSTGLFSSAVVIPYLINFCENLRRITFRGIHRKSACSPRGTLRIASRSMYRGIPLYYRKPNFSTAV